MAVWVSSEVFGRDRKGGGMVNCYRLVGNGLTWRAGGFLD